MDKSTLIQLFSIHYHYINGRYNDDIYLQSTEINNPSYVKHAAILYQQAEKFLKNAILSDDEKENLINELNYSF